MGAMRGDAPPAAAGTAMVADLFPGSYGSQPSDIVGAGNRVFFTAADGIQGNEPWVLDPNGLGPAFALTYGAGCAPIGTSTFAVTLSGAPPTTACTWSVRCRGPWS